MKKVAPLFIGIIILLVGIIYSLSFTKNQKTNTSTSIITPLPTIDKIYCTQQNIEATVALDHAAGNVYGTFTIKNISQKLCKIRGGEFIQVNYDTVSIKNIHVSHIGNTQVNPFILLPGQSLYSQVHYPNGPQCQSVGLHAAPVTFSYLISPKDTVTFRTSENMPTMVQTCTLPSEMTTIEVWNMSPHPITP